jgi:2-alkenal reductase
VAKALIETGRYEHPFLGISFGNNPVTTAVAKRLNLPVQNGVFVGGVQEGGPSDKAGLRASEEGIVTINGYRYPAQSDIIIKIDDQVVNGSDDIIDYLATDTEVGQIVTLTILREGKQQELKVTLGARPRPEE